MLVLFAEVCQYCFFIDVCQYWLCVPEFISVHLLLTLSVFSPFANQHCLMLNV